MKKRFLYVKDSQALRITLCIYLVFVELFQFFWTYFISPISYRYAVGFSNPYTVTGLCINAVCVIAFVVLSFFDYKKSWKSFYIFYGVTFIVDAAHLMISIYEKRDLHTPDSSGFLVLTALSYIIFGVICLLMLTEKRVFKYIIIVFSLFFIITNIVDIVSWLESLTSEPTFRTVYVYDHLLADWEEPFCYITSVITAIPTFVLTLLILTFFIRFKKTEGNQAVYTYENQVDNPYQPYQNYVVPQPVAPVTEGVKYCSRCGTQVNNKDVFCKKCGNRFT